MARRSEWGKVYYSVKHRSLMINRYVGDRKPYRTDRYFVQAKNYRRLLRKK